MLGRINGIPEYAHRVAYAIWFGEWPSQQIDHINGNRADNRIANLRQVDASGNQRNKLVSKVGASGNIGVYWHAATNKWLASIGLNGRQTHLGLFEQKSDAVDARRRAELENGFTLRVAQ